MCIDVRQESARHIEALSEITCYLGLGDYASSYRHPDVPASLLALITWKP
ncbi:hypothetical protein [Sodalis-like endosymbiont of Proechinophthirus fluctus]